MWHRQLHRWTIEAYIAAAVLIAASIAIGIVLFNAEAQVLAGLHWIRTQGLWAPFLFMAVYATAVVLLLPGLVLTMGAGFLFGVAQGSALVIIGETIGATVAFLIGRGVLGAGASRFLVRQPRLAVLNARLSEKAWKVVLVTRLIPFFPFKLSNYFFGLAGYSLRGFVFGTVVGIVPFTLTNVYLGSLAANLATLEVRSGERSDWEWVLYAGGLLATLVAATYVGRVATRTMNDWRKTERGNLEKGTCSYPGELGCG